LVFRNYLPSLELRPKGRWDNKKIAAQQKEEVKERDKRDGQPIFKVEIYSPWLCPSSQDKQEIRKREGAGTMKTLTSYLTETSL
jgi:hypothetical protein